MTFSNTQPLVHARLGEAELDPLYDAWNVVREARRVSLDEGIEQWAEQVREMVAQVAGAVSTHATAMESAESPLMKRLRDPDDSRAVQEQLSEHARLGAAVDRVVEALQAKRMGNGEVLAVAEQLIELEIALARHLNRLHEILGRQSWQAPTRS